MSRYEHVMFPTKGNTFPGAIVSVEVVGDVTPTTSGRVLEYELLRSWHTLSGTKGGHGYEKAISCGGTQAKDFWEGLHRLCRKRGSVWVICPCAPRVWPMLNLWDMLEDGKLVLPGSPETDEHGNVIRKQGKRSALILVEEPVHALKLQFPDLPGVLWFVDARNYGVELRHHESTVDSIVSRGYMLLTGMAEALQCGQLGSLQVTAGSQAMYTFRRQFLRNTLFCHTSQPALDLEERAYVGGRCEAFRLGYFEEDLYHLDYSSLYAYCCTANDLPVRFRWLKQGGGNDGGQTVIDNLGRICDVTVETDLPMLPFKGREKTYYPTGSFRTTLCGPELAMAERCKMVRQYHTTAYYDMAPALSDYAQFWLEKRAFFRKHGMTDLETWTKRMLVSLPGKFGQRGRDWIDVPDAECYQPYHSWQRQNADRKWERFRSIAWYVQKEIQYQWGPESVPSIAAWICSAGRAMLWHAMMTAGLENVYYVDTDAIVCNVLGYSRITHGRGILGSDPGQLRLLWSGNRCHIRGWKDYTVGPHTVLSGVPRGQTGNAAPSGTVWVRSGMDEALKSGQRPTATRQLVSYYGNRIYKHGRVDNVGVVTPWNLPEDAYRCQ
jgi:hypothetical protein